MVSGQQLAVCGILIENGKVLTVSRKDDHTQLGLPGGKVDSGEIPEQAILRECFEETGMRVKINSLYSFADNIGEFYVICYPLIREEFEIEETAEEETGIVEFVEIKKLLDSKSSPFADYNRKAFVHLGIKL